MKTKNRDIVEEYRRFCDVNKLVEDLGSANFFAEHYLNKETKINGLRIQQLFQYVYESAWQKEYWDNDGVLYRDLDRPDDDTSIEDLGRYEIMFDYDGVRRYCFVDAINMNEALGLFFKNHATVQYRDIVEHIEI